ncbi:MAG: ABC transporter ATP-binding protein [Candidatus Methanomethylophilaceae archaeon]
MSEDSETKCRRHQKRGPHGPPGAGEKPKDFKLAWSKLFSYMGVYKKYVLTAIILACFGTAITLIGPDKLGDVTDMITAGIISGNIDLEGIAAIGMFLIGIYAVYFILAYIQNYILATVAQRTARNLRRDMSVKINKLPLSYLDRMSKGDILSRVTNDIDTIGQSLNMSIGMLVTSFTLLFGSLIMMGYTNLILMVTAVLATAFGFGLIGFIIKRSQKYFDIQQKNLGAMNGHVEEIYSAHNIVKAYNGEKEAAEKFDTINNDLFSSAFKSQFFSGVMMPLMNFIGNFGYVAVCIVGSVMTINGTISFGIVVSFMIYIRLFTQPFGQIAQAFTGMQSVAAASERVFEFIDAEEQKDESGKTKRLEHVKGDVEFRDVRFGYLPGKEVIHGFSAKISAGQKVAIVGPTGAGKTTIVNLLMRFYETDSGDILIDGISTKELTRANVHDQFCMVLQDTWLFEGTIKENIVYCKKGISDEQIINACKAVGIHHYIETLPNGYDTVLSNMAGLSAGQKQQLTIARAMIEDSPLLILDEATSSVDTRTERIIQEAMDMLTEKRTSFVIAHRLSTIRNSDIIFVMKDGNIIEQGSHDELLAKGGFYSTLYNSQFEDTDMDYL